ncbi:MAG TPA: hydantoinase/oxoprolinase family protein [Anaerolineae bacterium]|nr:hydantoinase/oxoprolinase family protein [Anaerolineae bacterium]
MSCRLGIDVGGTFTDLALYDDVTTQVVTEKVLTVPSDPWLGIQTGVRAFAERGFDLHKVSAVIHGTTLVTNALIERRGAKVGLLTTQGFRDVLHFSSREYRYDIYDPNIVLPEPLVPRQLRREVHERVSGDGTILLPLDKEHARTVIQGLLEEQVEAFAVCLLHSYLRPEHELALRELIEEQAPNLPISLSHEVLPQIREYERTSATTINAYVQPIVRRYLHRLRDGLKAEGCEGTLYMMNSSGGTMMVETAEAFPIQIVESGPTAGTLIATLVGKQINVLNVLSFDMGGTTAKACVCRNGKPVISQNYEVARVRRFKKGSGLPVGIPVIDLLEIGAGGGSIAEIDPLGLLRVGPRSAGADPGPVCYGRGGTEPTVTDANVVLGLVNPDYFLGGAMTLDRDAAARAIEERIGKLLGLDTEQAAAAIHKVVTENMAEAARVHSVEINVDIRDYGMVAFGGAGPIHAHGVAERLRMPFLVCPPEAGVLSALGLLTAPLSFEFARSLTAELDDLRVARINEILAELETHSRALLARAGVQDPSVVRSVDMCYVGQFYEVTTPLPEGLLGSDGIDRLKSLFNEAYEQAYGRRLDTLPARCVTWRVLATGPTPHIVKTAGSNVHNASDGHSPELARKGERRVVFPDHGAFTSTVYERARLQVGAAFSGPAVIEESASTITVPPGANAEVDAWGNVILRWHHTVRQAR